MRKTAGVGQRKISLPEDSGILRAQTSRVPAPKYLAQSRFRVTGVRESFDQNFLWDPIVLKATKLRLVLA